MTLHQIVSASVLGGSILLLLLILILPVFSGLRRRFFRVGTAFYVSGTGLVFLISMLKPTIPPNFVWIAETFVFGIYAFSSGLVIYVTKKFGANDAPGDSGSQDKKH